MVYRYKLDIVRLDRKGMARMDLWASLEQLAHHEELNTQNGNYFQFSKKRERNPYVVQESIYGMDHPYNHFHKCISDYDCSLGSLH